MSIVGELADALPPPPGDSWYAYFNEPANCVVSGAFRPAEIGANHILLERNPAFYAADRVDVDTVFFELLQNIEYHWAALMAGTRHYLRRQLSAEGARATPEPIDHQLVPAPRGLAMALNHRTAPYDDPLVRQAICYVLDADQIVQNANPMRYEAVSVPGAHAFRARELLGVSFVDETLTDYAVDREAAAERMRAAGYTRSEGTWVDDANDPVRVPMMSFGPTDTLAATAREQFAAFGFEPRPLETDVTPDGRRPAAFTTGFGTGFTFNAIGQLYELLADRESVAREHGIYPFAEIEAADYDVDGYLRDGIDEFTIEAPPIGEPEGDLQRWDAARLARECGAAGSEEAYVDLLRTLAWLYNWHLPVLPVANGYAMHFMNVERWDWPDLSADRFDGAGIGRFQMEDLLGLGFVTAR